MSWDWQDTLRADRTCRRRGWHGRLIGLLLSLALPIGPSALAQPATATAGGPRPGDRGRVDPSQAPATARSSPLDGVTFGLTLEGYYEYDWNRPPDRTIPLRAYDTRSNSFSLQQAAIVIDASPAPDSGRRFGVRTDLQFGLATDTVQGNPANEPHPEAYRHLWQMYGSYLVPAGRRDVRVDFGKYASMLGYETNYAKDNQAFSRALLFNVLPFYHSGLRVTWPVSDRVSVLYMLSNGIQQTEDLNDFKSHHVAAIVTPARAVTWTLNYYAGREQPDGGAPDGPDGAFRVFDTSVTVAPSPRLSLALDVNRTTNQVRRTDPALALDGLGLYGRWQLSPATAAGVRYERLDDDGLFGGRRQVLQEATLTGEYRLADGFLVRAEFRRDWSSVAFFPGARGEGDLRRHQHTALVGGIWWLGNKPGVW